jgi:hypothetical protein
LWTPKAIEMVKPIIFSCFANDDTEHLDLLKEESRQIKEALQSLEKKERIKLQREESAGWNDLTNIFRLYGQHITIFHYAGHASGAGLNLETGKAYADGLAHLLGNLKNLKLVFLNGCSTQGQVNLLLRQGVKVVIATSVPINDQRAKDFATAFYKSMASNATISEAFDYAKGALKLRYEQTPTIEINRFRGVDLDRKSQIEMPWGLFLLEENETILSWKLPNDVSVLDDLSMKGREVLMFLKKRRKIALLTLISLLVFIIGFGIYQVQTNPFRTIDKQIIESLKNNSWQNAFDYEDKLAQLIYFSEPDRDIYAGALSRLAFIKLEKGVVTEKGAVELLKIASILSKDFHLSTSLLKASNRFRIATEKAKTTALKILKKAPEESVSFLQEKQFKTIQPLINIGQNFPITLPVLDDIKPFLFAIGVFSDSENIIYSDSNNDLWLKANHIDQERLLEKLAPRLFFTNRQPRSTTPRRH